MINMLEAEYIDTSDQDLASHNRKFDFILSTLNVEFDMDKYLRMLKPEGKFCIVAQPPEKLSISLGLLYDYAQRTIYGNYTGSRRDMINMIAFSAQHDITIKKTMTIDVGNTDMLLSKAILLGASGERLKNSN